MVEADTKEESGDGINEKLKDGKANGRKETLDLVQDAMGAMGPWHVVIAVALSLVKFPVAWHQLGIVFLAPNVDFYCADEGAPPGIVGKCDYTLDNGTEVKCQSFLYDVSTFKKTIISEWDLVCDKSQYANFAQSCTMFGILFGNMVFSAMSDRMGRKVPLMVAILLQSVTGLMTVVSRWYWMFLFFKFLSAMATGGTMLISFVLLMEIVGPSWRSSLSVLFHVPFILGLLLNPLISYLTRTWYGFQMAVSIPPIFLLMYYWIIPESPRWLLAVGRTKEAEAILTTAANKNHIPLGKVNAAIEHYTNQATEKSQKENENKYNITHLFRTPNLRIKTICICINWFVCGTCFFGLAQYVGVLEGNIFFNTAISAVVELPGTVVVYHLISRVTRLRILMAGNILTGLTLLLVVFTNDPRFHVALATIGMAGMSISFPTLYLYSSEVFPTVVRNVGIGAGSICARVGSMIAPYIATMGATFPWMPSIVFGIAALVGASLCLLLPDTMNCDLPETIEDGENFGKKSRKKIPC